VSMWTRELRTSLWMWFVFSIAAFAIAGYLLEVPVGKDSARYWELAFAIARPKGAPLLYIAFLLVFWGLVLAVPCLGVGWVLQAMIQFAFARETQKSAS
jgi:hypothetical protein